ncbi:MAG: HD domain-containing protein [Pirellulales bacterium]|nr:HD domain-containing protein [Pirellulales bacterium]
MSDKRLRIPHEDVRLTADEIEITQTRTFQRLFDLKQLGLAYLVYPNATHSRAVHSIRCVGEAAKILAGLKANAVSISKEDEATVRIAALLHDIGHIPFSHTLEDEHQILSKHDRPKRLNRVLEMLKAELPPSQARLIDKATPILFAIAGAEPEKYPQSWRSDLVGNTVCADLLAYIIADAEAAGIEKRSGHYRTALSENRCCIKQPELRGFRSVG